MGARKRPWDGAVDCRTKKRRKLDAFIWSQTPLDIRRRILSFLPVRSLCRFKSVSKDWQSDILSSAINAEWYVTTNNDGDICFFDGSSWELLNKQVPNRGLTRKVSTSAGLVLVCDGYSASQMDAVVFNPLVPSCKRVLSPLKRPDVKEHLVLFAGIEVLSDHGKTYFAVVCLTKLLREGRIRLILHSYDSRAENWVVSGDIALRHHEQVYNKPVLLHDGNFYFVVASEKSRTTRWLMSVGIWDRKRTLKTVATWADLPWDRRQGELYLLCLGSNNPSLICCQGKLMLVNLTPWGPHRAIRFLCLDEGRRTWQEVASLSCTLLPDKVQESMKCSVYASGSRDSAKVALYFPCSLWGCIYNLADGNWRPVVPTAKSVFAGPKVLHPFQPSFCTF